MTPRDPPSNHSNGLFRYSVTLRQQSAAFGRCPNRENVALGQFAMTVSHTLRVVASTFGELVVRVLLRGSQEQMIRTNARRIIAAMAHLHPVRNRSICQLVTHAVGSKVPPSAAVLMNLTIGHRSWQSVASPQPASIRLLDSCPKTFNQWGWLRNRHQITSKRQRSGRIARSQPTLLSRTSSQTRRQRSGMDRRYCRWRSSLRGSWS
jgi:hypothetical protein